MFRGLVQPVGWGGGGNFQGGKFPKFPGGKFPGWEISRGETPIHSVIFY